MTIEIYPASPVPSFDYEINSEFKTLISEFDSGAEQRRMLRRFPKRIVGPLNYKFFYEADRKILQNFFQAQGGPFASFWFVDWIKRNWVDEYVGRGIWYAMAGAYLLDYPSTYTNETTAANNATTNDMTLLPNPAAVGDRYYFGCAEMFDQLRLVISTAGVGTWTIEWRYYNGSSWVALSGVVDGTSAFQYSGTHDVTFNRPSDWAKISLGGGSYYYIQAYVISYVSMSVQPKGTQAWTAIREYDLHSKTTTGGSLNIYVDSVLKTGGGPDYTFISGGGGASADRIRFVSASADGVLITSDFEGYLRIKARFKEDKFSELMNAPLLYNHQFPLYEVQW